MSESASIGGAAESEAEEEAIVLPSWWYWVERNARPKVIHIIRPPREYTRWQKRGPMSRRDWVNFYNWAARNALPKMEYIPPPKPSDSEQSGKKKKKKLKPPTLAQVFEDAEKLAKPRKPRKKYVYPVPEVFHYSPKISFSKPAHHDKGRPFSPPPVPKTFQHIDLEIEFWSTLRFPIMPSTANYHPSANILKLAQPRIMARPSTIHCPIPERIPEEPQPRKRMNRRQWREHLRRLEYLAKPVVFPDYDVQYL